MHLIDGKGITMYKSYRSLTTAAALVSLLLLLSLLLSSLPLDAETGDHDAYWPLNEGSGDTTADATDGSADAELRNMEESDWITGYDDTGHALQFGGNNDRDWIKTAYSPPAFKQISVSFWMKSSYAGNGARPIAYLETTRFFMLGFGGSPKAWGCGPKRRAFIMFRLCGVCSKEIPADDNWHHVVGVWDGSSANTTSQDQLTLYVDGDEATEREDYSQLNCGASYGDGFDTDKTLDIAHSTRSNDAWEDVYYDGSLDDIRVYERALTAAEVKELYLGKPPSISGPTTGFVGVTYTFEEELIAASKGSYTWDASGNNEIDPADESTANITWYADGTDLGTQQVTMTVTSGGTVFTDTHDITISQISPTLSGPTDNMGIAGVTYPFTTTVADADAEGTFKPITYDWQVTQQTDISASDERQNSQSFAWSNTISTTHYLTVTLSNKWIGTDGISTTLAVAMDAVTPDIEGATNGQVGANYSYPLTGTIDMRLDQPYTYTWTINGNDVASSPGVTETQDFYRLTSTISGTNYVTLTVQNPWVTISNTHQIKLTATTPSSQQSELVGPDILAFNQTGRFTMTVRPQDTTRPFTYTWDIQEDVSPQTTDPSLELADSWDSAVLSSTRSIAWDASSSDGKAPITRVVTVTAANAWGVITSTKEVSLTHRPEIKGKDGFSKEDDNPTEITEEDDGTVVLTIDEDTATGPINFTVVDTDTLDTLNLAAAIANQTDELALSADDMTIEKESQDGGTYTNTITITPPANQWGEADIRLDAGDGLVEGARTIHLVVQQVNDQPTFTKGDDVTVDEDAGAQVFSGWVPDLSPGPFEYSIQTTEFTIENSNTAMFAVQPTLSISGTGTSELSATLHFTTKPHANGSAVVTATLQDDSGADNDTSDAQTFTITVNPVNDLPIANDDSLTATENQSLTISTTQLLANDSDVDLEVAEIDEDQELTIVGVTAAQSGTVVLNENKTITYTPPPFTTGVDVFTYTLSDGIVMTPTARVTVVIDPMIARDDTLTTLEDTPLSDIGDTLLGNDRQPALSSFTAVAATSQQSGTVSLNGGVSYTPYQDFFGTDMFTYTIDLEGTKDTATVTVTVTPVNDAPSFQVGNDQKATADTGEQVVENWATDIVPGPSNEMTQTLTFTVTNDNEDIFQEQPALDSDGTLRYTPTDEDVEGDATVTVLLRDNGGTTNGGKDTFQQTFIISIRPNEPPLASTDYYTTDMEVALDIDVADLLTNDSDPNEGDTLTFTSVGSDSRQAGTVEWNEAQERLTYTPATRFFGTDSFTYTVSDGKLQSEGTVSVLVRKTGSFYTYIPLVQKAGTDLVASFTLTPDKPTYTAEEEVLITVTVTNQGNKATDGGFWVDFFFNPQQPPTQANVRWDQEGVYTEGFWYGLVWQVTDVLGPGESVTLVSEASGAGSYDQEYSRNWNGHFLSGTTDLYVFADSWNDEEDVASGAIVEDNETNNVFHREITVTGSAPASLSTTATAPIPPRR